jgi:hypothetical protein
VLFVPFVMVAEQLGLPQMGERCNSAGLAGLQAAIQQPDGIRGVQLTNISLRMLHASKQSRFQRPAVAMVQRVLRETNVGQVLVRSGTFRSHVLQALV